ncbi:hypothetical protein MMC11_003066 [Xylographa trunciseda]|nr:hypothetical protein [Xylographa trunciseda]
MLSSIFSGKEGRRRGEQSPLMSPLSRKFTTPRSMQQSRRRDADFDSPNDHEDSGESEEQVEDEDDDEEEDGLTPLLPIFEAAQLDALPVYNLTHTIRLLVIPRCETTLSWDQLRSPQVSQFLVKPIQQQILTSHFNKATLYALVANCLQFNKEAQMSPGNSGTSKTRAMVCELLAIKLLKEFSTRELVRVNAKASSADNALSYDFYPLQGLVKQSIGSTTPTPNFRPQTGAARISTLEIAIRAQAKRFLAHPLVVQQLEAIWAGTIVFHSAADNLHRPPIRISPSQTRRYGAIESRIPTLLRKTKSLDRVDSVELTVRRSVTLYDPRDASLFKLSRLRVPRYRQFLSTCSFAVLLGLFVAVLVQRSLHITALEVIFWFWSAGFMLDEIVGFNEQGFSLYIMSFWNTFDLGILLLLICYYCMRLYGILMPDLRKRQVANLAYDILATNAVILFPRLFSVLDHYRYFSQLLIAFRMMAVDLVAVFILIIISCSGFFVAFTLAFGNDDFNGGNVAYALFQMLMGFTPAAWDQWSNFNVLGRGILTLFLFICHFLIVTILITVLTNSFMAIVQNANDEHQFVFAVNTISMVKSDALFSYVAPTNVLAWLLTPLRFVLPFRQFVRVNRTVIKITHFPVLFAIYGYERVILRRSAFELTELVEQRGRNSVAKAFDTPGSGLNLFSPRNPRLREPSVATYHKDRALAEVFRRPFRDNTMRSTQKSHERRKTSNVVNNWMQSMGPEGTASPPAEQDHSVVDRLENRRPLHMRSLRRRQGPGREFTATTRSVASDPEEFTGTQFPFPRRPANPRDSRDVLNAVAGEDLPEQTDGDGDDELVTNEDTTLERATADGAADESDKENHDDFFNPRTPKANSLERIPQTSLSFADSPGHRPETRAGPQRPRRGHTRNLSTNTILYNPPVKKVDSSSSPSRNATTARNSAKNTAAGSGNQTPVSAGRRTPKRPLTNIARPRPILPPRFDYQSTPNIGAILGLDSRRDSGRSPMAMDIISDLGDNKAAGGGFIGAVPASFATQMAFANNGRRSQADQATDGAGEDQRMMSRLMLARMNTMEEGFREVIKEVKELRKGDAASTGDDRRHSKVTRRAARKAKPELKGREKIEAQSDGKGREIGDWVAENQGPEGEQRSSV